MFKLYNRMLKQKTDWKLVVSSEERFGMIFMVLHGLVWFCMDWHGLAWIGMDWHGLAWFGMVWLGLVGFGMVW